MPEKNDTKVLLLVSGGPDSATLAALIRESEGSGAQIHGLYLRSGHPSDEREIASASKILESVGGKLEIIDLTPTVRALGAQRVLIHSEASIMPFGNVLVLSIASTYALRLGCRKIFVALHADDAAESAEYSIDYIKRLEATFRGVTNNAPTFEVPLIHMTKVEVFNEGARLGVDYGETWSCIRGSDKHCGDCGACRARRKAFVRSALPDPTSYDREPLGLETVGFEQASA